jgi:hypothetical protein
MYKLLIFTILSLTFVSCFNQQQVKNDNHNHTDSKIESYYTCSMHPSVKEDKPGKCPICHMNLTKVEVEHDDQVTSAKLKKSLWQCENFPDVTSEKEDICPMDGTPMVKVNNAGATIGKVKLRKSQLSHFKPAFFEVTKMKMTREIRLLGSVMQSEDKESSIPARIGGRVEKVYIKSTGSLISLGDPVVDLYSPKLITAGEEYLIARKSYEKNKTEEFKDLYKQSEKRLKQWGIKIYQFENWYKSGKVPKNITIYSSATGIVRKRNANSGKYFKEGQNFFELSDLSSVWVEMDVYEHDSNLIHIGQSVEFEFTAIPGHKLSGDVDFIDPVLNQKSRTLKIRTTIKNEKGLLKPGMVADAKLKITLDGLPLVIPRSAVIDTGKRKVVWIKISDSQFQAKTILTGIESQGFVEVKKGLMASEEVVMDGNFLLDAQAQLFGGFEDIQ